MRHIVGSDLAGVHLVPHRGDNWMVDSDDNATLEDILEEVAALVRRATPFPCFPWSLRTKRRMNIAFAPIAPYPFCLSVGCRSINDMPLLQRGW